MKNDGNNVGSSKHNKTPATMSVVSLFSGCGGLDLGFEGGFEVFGKQYERLPFDIKWANDLNPAACRSYKRNLADRIQCGDVWEALATLPSHADVVIGGFPCQDLSINGLKKGVAGVRSGLYKAMVEAVRKLRPKAFVAENVRGLLLDYNKDSYTQVMSDFRALGYEVRADLYLAADYGVPQMRQRVFIVGTLPGVRLFQPPAPIRSRDEWMTAKEAVSDLEAMAEDADFNHVWSRAAVSGEQGNRTLKSDRPADTMRAECHGNIQFHYKLPRRISMREAARFQSFPDTFIFDAKLRETERQVGNAVPPIMGWHIAKALSNCLQ